MSDAPPKAEQESSLKIYFRLLGYVKPYIGMFLAGVKLLWDGLGPV